MSDGSPFDKLVKRASSRRLLESFRRAYAKGRDADVGRILIVGLVLTYLGNVMIFPLFFVMGYVVRVLRTAAEGGRTLPPFTNWLELLADGIKAYAIWYLYLLLALLNSYILTPNVPTQREVSNPGLLVEILKKILGNDVFELLLTAVITLLQKLDLPIPLRAPTLESYLLLLLSLFIAPAAVGLYATTDDMTKAFSLSELRKVVLRKYYLPIWLGFLSLWVASVAVVFLPYWEYVEFQQFQNGAATANIDRTIILKRLYALSEGGANTVANQLFRLLLLITSGVGFVLNVGAFYVLGYVWQDDNPRPIRRLSDAVDDRVQPIQSEIKRRYGVNIASALAYTLTMVSLGILALVPTSGFHVRTVRFGLDRRRKRPSFAGWVSLLVSGVYGSVVWLAYVALPVVVLYVFTLFSVLTGQSVRRTAGQIYESSHLEASSTLLTIFNGNYLGQILASFVEDAVVLTLRRPDVQKYIRTHASFFIENLPFLKTISLLVFFEVSVIALYVAPAAFATVVSTGRLRTLLNVQRTLRASFVAEYGRVWRKMVALLLVWVPVSVALFEWIESVQDEGFTILGVIEFPVFNSAGPGIILTSLTAIVVNFVVFFPRIVAYYLLGRRWATITANAGQESLSWWDLWTPMRASLLPFCLLTGPSVALFWWGVESTVLAHGLFAVSLLFGYVASAFLVPMAAINSEGGFTGRVRSLTELTAVETGAVVVVWLLAMSYLPASHLAPTVVDAVMPVYRWLWRPIMPFVESRVPLQELLGDPRFIGSIAVTGVWLYLVGRTLGGLGVLVRVAGRSVD